MKMWEIRSHSQKDELEEAYECGYEDGYKAASEEHELGERRYSTSKRYRYR